MGDFWKRGEHPPKPLPRIDTVVGAQVLMSKEWTIAKLPVVVKHKWVFSLQHMLQLGRKGLSISVKDNILNRWFRTIKRIIVAYAVSH